MTSPAERNSEGRERVMDAFELVCPNVVGNPFIPHWPLPAQAVFLGLHQTHGDNDEVFQALYGGAAGGGKSDALLMAAAQYAWKNPEFAGIMFRRTFADLTQPGALMDRAMEWWLPAGVKWHGSKGFFRFPSGAKVAFAYLRAPNDHLKYQGAEYQYTAWDELTQWPTARPYEYVGLSRVRRLVGSTVPLRTLAASNPGGPGHNWVMRKFVGGIDPTTGQEVEPDHQYVPARIQDNPYLDQDAYIRGLLHLHPTVREQLLNGDWRAREAGDYFRAEWFGPLLNPEVDTWPSRDCVRIRWWDLAASEKPDAKRTAGVRMARHRSGVRAIEHGRAFKATPGKRDDLIVQTAKADGRGVYVGIEIEPGSGGVAQFHALERRLKSSGYRVIGARPRAELTDAEGKTMTKTPSASTGKEARADPVASCLERGYQRRGECPDTGGDWWGLDSGKDLVSEQDGIRLFTGTWTQDFLDEVEGFPDGELCDYVDATSGAWSWLEAHPFGVRQPSTRRSSGEAAEQHDLHPSQRTPRTSIDKDKGGRWRP